ncbi:hypothetical protein MSAN_01581800 [Mycena sanguinolenta]|uniref:Uncharacterized protein n=1 Tax=Mycena sanguinolenta TaxID=230812 RepID=A0A8H6Y012_9AGAR|nr:hypothetical protein MSAN_01581800 [Mycena sanguinolenta]
MCVPTTSSFRLHDFQGHTLNLGAGINPIISYPPQVPIGTNEKWSLNTAMELVTAENGQVVTWAQGSPNNLGFPALAQAVTTTGTGLSFTITCINSTSGSIKESSGRALTAWLAPSAFLQSPVTFEDFANIKEQIWTLEELD